MCHGVMTFTFVHRPRSILNCSSEFFNLIAFIRVPLSFGKRNGGSARRSNECFVLEHSEMMVIDYLEKENTTNKVSIATQMM